MSTKGFWITYAFVVILAALWVISEAHAAPFSGLFCGSEQAVTQIADAIVANKSDTVFASLEEKGCVTLSENIDAILVYEGAIYTGPDGRFQVIGLAHNKGEMPLIFGLRLVHQPKGAT